MEAIRNVAPGGQIPLFPNDGVGLRTRRSGCTKRLMTRGEVHFYCSLTSVPSRFPIVALPFDATALKYTIGCDGKTRGDSVLRLRWQGETLYGSITESLAAHGI